MRYRIREIYKGNNVEIPDEFESTSTYPPIHFMKYVCPVKDGINILTKAVCLAGMTLTLVV